MGRDNPKREREKEKNLKRKVERLRKQLRQYEGALLEPENLDEDLERDFEAQKDKDRIETTIKCSKCKSPVELVDLGRAVYRVCTNRAQCWHRERA